MDTLTGIFTNIASIIANLMRIIWSVTKWLFSKSWKFILLIGAFFVAIFGIKKASKEE